MKKLLVGLLSLLLIFCLFGCGEKSPTEVTQEAFDAAKARDSETVNRLYLGEDINLDALVGEDAAGTDVSAENMVLLDQKLLDYDFTIDSEKIDGDKAVVTITFTTYDFGAAIKAIYSETLDKAIEIAMVEDTDTEINRILNESMATNLSALTEKTKETSTSITLTKGKDGWGIDDFMKNIEFINAITGGAYDAISNIGTE